MALADVIEIVASMLAEVDGVGSKVHASIRWGASEAAFKELFVDSGTGKVLGWTITREATGATDLVGATIDKHTLVIRGYMGLKDEENTEKTFQDLIEAIRDAFNSNRRLRVDGVSNVSSSNRIAVRTVGHREFGGYLVHYAELVLLTEGIVIP
jgi:hypothetical protein